MKGDRLRSMGAELIASLGLVFVTAGVIIWFTSVLPTTDSGSNALYELVIHVSFGGVMLVLGVHTERSDLEPHERFDVMVWCFSGFLVLVGLAIWGQLGTLLSRGLTPNAVSDIVVFGSMGGAFGVIAGINWGRAARNRELAEQNEAQRETLMLLNRLMGHDIRNDIMVIAGNADVLADQVTSEGASSVDVIQRRSDTILRLLEDTDTLVETLGGDHELEPVDLTLLLREETVKIRQDHPGLTVERSIPDGLRVVADGLVHQLFSNLLENAVQHNDPEGLTITVEARDAGDTVDVVVADDGSGIPEEVRDDCFELGQQGERSDGDGLGLYLVSRLAAVYGGEVTLAEGTDGATFEITLPAAD